MHMGGLSQQHIQPHQDMLPNSMRTPPRGTSAVLNSAHQPQQYQMQRQLSQQHHQLDRKHEQMMGGDPSAAAAALMMGMPHMGGSSMGYGGRHSHHLGDRMQQGGWAPSSLGPPPRMSDPGFAHPLLSVGTSMLNPQPHLNRISDSGQAFGLANCRPQDLAASLESLVASLSTTPAASPPHLQGRQQAPMHQLQAPMHRQASMHRHSTGGSQQHNSINNMGLGDNSRYPQQLQQQQMMMQQQTQQQGMANNGGNQITNLVSQLQVRRHDRS